MCLAFHSEAVFLERSENFLHRGDSHSERMDFQGWREALEACLQERNNNIENDNKNTPGLRFLFFVKAKDMII